MVVEVETPEGIKSESSVVEVRTTESSNKILSTDKVYIRGEGVFIDFANCKTLFVLLHGSELSSYPHALIYDAIPYGGSGPGNSHNRMKYYGTLKNAKGVVPPEKYPRMVYFEDINDPLSVKRVTLENMEDIFGEGVEIKQITVQTTNTKLQSITKFYKI
jgi:hypothetical protein